MSLLKATGLRASYGQVDVLLGIDIEVNEGEMVVVLGANGAGKTTTMRMIMGLIRPTEGEIEINGINALEINLNEFRNRIRNIPCAMLSA